MPIRVPKIIASTEQYTLVWNPVQIGFRQVDAGGAARTALGCMNRGGCGIAEQVEETLAVEEISSATLDEDFRRNPRIHRAWKFQAR